MLSYFPFWTFWSHFSLVCYPCRDPSGKLTTDRRNSMCLLLLSWFYFKTTSQHISFILCTLDTLFTIINFYKMHHYHFLLCRAWSCRPPVSVSLSSLQVLFYATILIFPSHCPRHKEEIGCFQFYCGLNKVRQQYIFTSLLYHFFGNFFSLSSYSKTFEEKKTECTFLQLILSWVNLLKRENKIHWDSFSVGPCWPIRAGNWPGWPIRGQLAASNEPHLAHGWKGH